MSQWLLTAAENGGRSVRRREWMLGWVWGWPQQGVTQNCTDLFWVL